jgi:hypothetical protein
MNTYSGYLRQYADFTVFDTRMCTGSASVPYPATEESLMRYLAWLAMRGVVSIDQQMSAIHSLHKLHGLPTQAFASARIFLFKKALKRDLKQRGLIRPRRVRLPLLRAQLRKMRPALSIYTNPNHTRLWCAALVGLYGIMRAGELTISSDNVFNPHTHVTRKHAKVYPDHATIFLPASKTDRLGHGTKVTIPHIAEVDHCPHCMLRFWLQLTNTEEPDAHLFSIKGTPYAKTEFIKEMQQTLRSAGVPNVEAYTGHSLRLGGATFAKAAGLNDDQIQVLGRWSSVCYQRYIVYSTDQLREYAQQLADAADMADSVQHSEADLRTWAAQQRVSPAHDTVPLSRPVGSVPHLRGCR